MAASPDRSEYFLAGRNDGGALMDESMKNITVHAPGKQFICSVAPVYLHVTAVSGHCSVRSVARICLRDRQVRFLLPPTGLSANEHFLKTGFVSIVVCFDSKRQTQYIVKIESQGDQV